jgi:hypothetical protein
MAVGSMFCSAGRRNKQSPCCVKRNREVCVLEILFEYRIDLLRGILRLSAALHNYRQGNVILVLN